MPGASETRGIGPYTWSDFVQLAESDRRELIDGWLVEVEVPSGPHECIVSALIGILYAWTRRHRGARVMASGYKVRVSDRRGVMPDLLLHGSEAALARDRPDLVVEVLSPSSRRYDRVTKLQYYASIAVPEYWIVDGEACTVERLVLQDGIYAIAESLAGDSVLRPDRFEGLEVPLAELWEAAEDGRRIEGGRREA